LGVRLGPPDRNSPVLSIRYWDSRERGSFRSYHTSTARNSPGALLCRSQGLVEGSPSGIGKARGLNSRVRVVTTHRFSSSVLVFRYTTLHPSIESNFVTIFVFLGTSNSPGRGTNRWDHHPPKMLITDHSGTIVMAIWNCVCSVTANAKRILSETPLAIGSVANMFQSSALPPYNYIPTGAFTTFASEEFWF
jgi:hypothetical protein